MPSPFPGMDPYLEAPAIWPDFHDRLATEISSTLNGSLPAPYYARLEMRPEVGIVALPSEPIRHRFVEIRDPTRGHQLVTLIEILSPSNKRPGPDQQAYRRKRDEVLSSDVNLIELDLLREGDRLRPRRELELWLEGIDPPALYVVWLSRAWRRDRFEVFPIGLRDPLPRIPLPLREGEPEPVLDLQEILARVYDGGPYRRGAVDYGSSPEPPLNEEDRAWAAERLRNRG